jgi:hypothetical protein
MGRLRLRIQPGTANLWMGGGCKVPADHGCGSRFAGRKAVVVGGVPPVLLPGRVRDRIRVKRDRIRSKETDSECIERLVISRGKVRQSALGAVTVDAVPNILFEWPHTAVRQGC